MISLSHRLFVLLTIPVGMLALLAVALAVGDLRVGVARALSVAGLAIAVISLTLVMVAVREREALFARYRLLVERARDMIIFIRRSDGRVLDVNPAALAAYGYTRDEFVQLTVNDLRTPEAEATLGPFIDLSDDAIRLYESEHRRKNGSSFPVESASQVAELDGERVVLSINRDITDRKQTEKALAAARDQALEASRLKSQFVAMMSHEIRTPMNGVIAMAELLAGTRLDAEQQEYARTIKESGEALLRIINEILDFSKVEAGRLELEIENLSLVRVVEATAQLVASSAHAKRLQILSDVDPSMPPMVYGDAGRLRQVLMNLAGNAVKFTQQGHVIVRAINGGERGRRVDVRFEIEDTGIGIPEEARARLFQPFVQADGSTTRRYGGTGLGLAISKRIVELMGGEIGVRSKAGHGSTFWLRVPFERAGDATPLRLAAFHGIEALVTGGNGPAAGIVTRYLDSWGVACRCIPDLGRAAVAAAQSARAGRPLDLALLDIGMAHVDDDWVRAGVAALRNEVRHVVVVGQPDAAGGRATLERGVAAYLTTPLRQSTLFDCLAMLRAEDDTDVPQSSSMLPVVEDGGIPGDAPISFEAVVVLAEDNAINQRVALNQLRKLGVAAVVVENGRQAVEAAVRGGFAAILMDCQMPEMDGFEATRAIRRAEMRTGRHLPIIAMTANALEEDRRACIAAGMDDYISKPVAFSELRDTLLRWLPGTAAEERIHEQ